MKNERMLSLAATIVVLLVFVVHGTPVQNKNTTARKLSQQPIYEMQIVAWPTGLENIPQLDEISHPVDNFPVIEDQITVYPEDSSEEEVDVVNTENDEHANTMFPSHPPTVSTENDIVVLENYYISHPNGTSEYKLILSNGLVNYKKMYSKTVEGKTITVQEGYDSVPIPDHPNEYQTTYYIADENGHNIYKREHSYQEPTFPVHLDFKNNSK